MEYFITGVQHGVVAVAAVTTFLIGTALFTPVVLAIFGVVGNILAWKEKKEDACARNSCCDRATRCE